MDQQTGLSRRERQIMDVLYAKQPATVADVRDGLPDPPSSTAVRTLLRILEEKGHVRCRKRGRENVYSPRRGRLGAGRSALQRVIDVFFDGSLESAVGAHLSNEKVELREEELQRIARLIDEARRRDD
ncbi:MAG: BlaI/MecI/CopY family transcriptional regulator [Phycisphaerae bacterium]|nr:BlaI/MecI/CopY family transcriptional regulator [Phycisphaerae bacterium]